ncbi:MAG: zinc ribbon domain-containing protein [Candidatus Bathyarchaeia archaeon]
MAQIIVLKCPNCGALLDKEQMKCQYCGADLVLSPDGSYFIFRAEATCPKCGAINEKSSWFCMGCNTILTKDTDMLKELQKKIRLEQESMISCMPSWMGEKLEPDEFIYFVLYEEIGGNNFYAITDKRIIKSRHGKYEEALLSEVVSIGPVRTKQVVRAFVPPVIGFFHVEIGFFKVNTSRGTTIFEFEGYEVLACGIFHAWTTIALENYTAQKKDVKALILKLPLGVEQQ